MNFPLITQHIKPRSVLDIGAHTGGWYRDAVQHWPDAYYFLIEGNPACAPALADTGVSHRIALLSDREKEVTFHTRRGIPCATGDSYLREKTPFYADEHLVSTTMETRRLDDVCEGCVFDLVKLDTQGSELDIMRGGDNIMRMAKAVVIEVSHVEYNEGAPSEETVSGHLRSLGFRPVEVVERLNYCLPPHHHIQSSVLFLKQP